MPSSCGSLCSFLCSKKFCRYCPFEVHLQQAEPERDSGLKMEYICTLGLCYISCFSQSVFLAGFECKKGFCSILKVGNKCECQLVLFTPSCSSNQHLHSPMCMLCVSLLSMHLPKVRFPHWHLATFQKDYAAMCFQSQAPSSRLLNIWWYQLAECAMCTVSLLHHLVHTPVDTSNQGHAQS